MGTWRMVAIAILMLGLAACGSTGTKSEPTAMTAPAITTIVPEVEVAPVAQVAPVATEIKAGSYIDATGVLEAAQSADCMPKKIVYREVMKGAHIEIECRETKDLLSVPVENLGG